MSKHTPGPWYWCDGEDKKDLPYLTSKAGKICEFGNWEAYYPQCGDVPNKADARLIAAAPELLEALHCLTAVIGLTPIDRGNLEALEEAYEQARAAIAKAKGEQP